MHDQKVFYYVFKQEERMFIMNFFFSVFNNDCIYYITLLQVSREKDW